LRRSTFRDRHRNHHLLHIYEQLRWELCASKRPLLLLLRLGNRRD
jgi:hypothetical protein